MFEGSPIKESFRSLTERMVEDAKMPELSTAELNIRFWQPRVTGSITFISSLCILLMAWNRRKLLFHRLVLGMSLNQLISSLFKIYGVAAFPSNDTNTNGNFGTVATCTTQGFFIYVCDALSMFYYASFSVYSFVGILSNFEKEKYEWVEKYIHAILPIYPLITAIVILSKQGFNPSSLGGYCTASNTDWYCDDPNYGDVPCERGHLNHPILWYSVFYIITLFFPTVVMFFLYIKVTQQQSQIFIKAKVVAKQSAIYLFVLYLAILSWFVIACMIESGHGDNVPFPAIIFADVSWDLFGLYIILIYTYFTFDRLSNNGNRNRTSDGNDNGNGNGNGNATDNDNDNDNATKKDSTATTTTNNKNNEVNAYNNEFIFGSEKVIAKSSTAPMTVADPTPTSAPVTEKPRYSFNIFDGTNAVSGAFAAFIHDGDSEDERVDHAQTVHWEAIQDHV